MSERGTKVAGMRSKAEVEQALALAKDRLNVRMPKYAMNALLVRIQVLEWVLGEQSAFDDVFGGPQ